MQLISESSPTRTFISNPIIFTTTSYPKLFAFAHFPRPTPIVANSKMFNSRFDCGSGVGMVRSEETVLLNQWNHITLYRHRWDAWLQLNGGKHVQGRSKGLFSRITFREPLFIGGAGNTTGLSEKLPVSGGLKGCIRHLEVNDHLYRFALEPNGEASKGYGVGK